MNEGITVRTQEKDYLDITDLTNEELLDKFVKYGLNPGPLVNKLIKHQLSFDEAVPQIVIPSSHEGRVGVLRTTRLSLVISMTKILLSLQEIK